MRKQVINFLAEANKYRGNLKACFEAGVSSVKDGANTENCHFGLFATKEMTEAWEAGVKYAKEEQK